MRLFDAIRNISFRGHMWVMKDDLKTENPFLSAKKRRDHTSAYPYANTKKYGDYTAIIMPCNIIRLTIFIFLQVK